jgi:hypothetical protein
MVIRTSPYQGGYLHGRWDISTGCKRFHASCSAGASVVEKVASIPDGPLLFVSILSWVQLQRSFLLPCNTLLLLCCWKTSVSINSSRCTSGHQDAVDDDRLLPAPVCVVWNAVLKLLPVYPAQRHPFWYLEGNLCGGDLYCSVPRRQTTVIW